MLILLVGTNHAHQYIGNEHGNSERFAQHLRQACFAHTVDLIAEEMSLEALEINSTKSTAFDLANTLGIEHAFCDPNQAERIALEIPTVDELKVLLGLGKCLSNEQVDRLEQAERSYWPIREAEWLRRIESRSYTTCLLIIGANHVSSFSDLALSRGTPIRILNQRWRPKVSSLD